MSMIWETLPTEHLGLNDTNFTCRRYEADLLHRSNARQNKKKSTIRENILVTQWILAKHSLSANPPDPTAKTDQHRTSLINPGMNNRPKLWYGYYVAGGARGGTPPSNTRGCGLGPICVTLFRTTVLSLPFWWRFSCQYSPALATHVFPLVSSCR